MRFPVGSRTVTNVLMTVVAGFLVVACFGFAPRVVAWLGLGTGCVAVVTAATGFGLRFRGADQRALDALGALIGGWLIVASRAFGDPGTARWLCFSAAVALVALALLGLLLADAARVRELRALAHPRVEFPDVGSNGHDFIVPYPSGPLRSGAEG